jgi:sulfite reductase alpha subunit-like flavoprotein
MVCGNKNTLGKSVMDALQNIIGEKELENMKEHGRLLVELWNE